MTLQTPADILARLDRTALETAVPLFLKVGAIRLRLRCLPPLRDDLAEYFAEVLTDNGPTDATVDVLEGQALDPAPHWRNWRREPGKTGRKDAIWELENGRLIFKQRTGVTFLQSPRAKVAFGPVRSNLQQVINFLNTQILNLCQRQGWKMCHAAAVTNGTRSLAIAGLSGGGKSTAILRMMDIAGTAFVSNDRLLVRAGSLPPQALGIPKQPRINPGTILHNARLHPLLPPERLTQLSRMAPTDLWNLEEKYDLMIPQIYGCGRVDYACRLTDFWVLNWQHDSRETTRIREISLPDRPDLLAAMMKQAGPFFQDAKGRFRQDGDELVPSAYLDALRGVRVSEVSGRIDFESLYQSGVTLLGDRM